MHYNQSERQAFGTSILGFRVDRATQLIAESTNYALFTIAGGLVLLRAIVGEVTIVIGATHEAKLTVYPTLTTAGDTDLCTALDLNVGGIAPVTVGCLLSITGTPGDAMLVSIKGSVETMLPKGVVLQEGGLHLTGSTTTTGSIKWSMWYIPIDKGAYVTAA